jgi:DNA polymerase III epsilon subunit-like protein
MLDLETLSTRPHAVILIIGAIKFNRNDNWSSILDEKELMNQSSQKYNTFYRRIKISSCMAVDMNIQEDTQKWWKEQDEDIRYEAIDNPDRVELKQALRDFKDWFGNSTCIWGNGSNFDCTILGEAYARCGIEIPWKYWLVRDLRTVMDLGRVRMSDLPQVNKHHALYDCWRQVIGLQQSLKKIKKL